MIITDFKVAKKDRNRIHIYIDDIYKGTIYIDYVVEYGLKLGSEITQNKLDEIVNISNNKKLFNECLRYVGIRQRSEKEIKEYIYKKAQKAKFIINENNIDEIINNLKKYNYINDEAFASLWVTTRINKGVGPQKLKMELIQKGVEKVIIEQIISTIDEETKTKEIQKITQKYLKTRSFTNEYEKKWKLKQYLMSKGF